MRYAVIKNGIVANVIEADADFSLPGFALVASETASLGDHYAGGVFSAPVAASIDLVDEAAAIRFGYETAGITVAGSNIDTSRESQNMINGAYAYVQKYPATTINFKTEAGFVTLDATQITAIAEAVGLHVQSMFTKEKDVVSKIGDGTITTIDEIIAEFEA